MRLPAVAAALLSATRISAAQPDQVPLRGDAPRPNVVFILTDDQDVHLESLNYMPLVKKHLIDQGTLYNKHYCTTAVCCPSRVTLWTGKAAHNTNITDVNPPYGNFNCPRPSSLPSLIEIQAAIPSSSPRVSMINIYLCGCNKLDTTHTTLESSSMCSRSPTTTLPFRQASLAR